MVLGPFEKTITMFLQILRTKRRAFALISGIMLGTMILSGIVLYSNVLQERNFASIVGNSPYEIVFDKFNGESMDSLRDLGENIETDMRVESWTEIGTIFSNNRNSILSASFQLNPNDQYSEGEPGSVRPLFVSDTFFDSTIGQTLDNENFKGDFNVTKNSVLISNGLSRFTGLEVGDSINRINITIQIFQDIGNIVGSGSVGNFTVAGIYENEFTVDPSEELDFADETVFELNNIIMHKKLLDNETDYQEVRDVMKVSGNFQLLVKIDEKQFSVSEPQTMVAEIETFINEISQQYGADDVVGRNIVAGFLLAFQIFSIFISVIYIMISFPVIFLSLYVLNYGMEISLEERKRDIAIKKVQGASQKQIFRELRTEIILIYILGLILGYFLSMLIAWLLGSSTGFFEISFNGINDFVEYISFDRGAVIISASIIGILLLFNVYKTGKKFVELEVTEGIARFEEIKDGFIKRNKVDLILFIIGLIGVVLNVAEEVLFLNLNTGVWGILLDIFSPFTLWIGGAIIGSRVAKWIPQVLEGFYLNLFFLEDVARMIKSGLRRRGDINRMVIIIILTLSIATMSVMQGIGDEYQVERDIQYQVGGDFSLSAQGSLNLSDAIIDVKGVSGVQPMPSLPVRVLSSTIFITQIDPERELEYLINGRGILKWQVDSFRELEVEEAMEKLISTSNGVFLSPSMLGVLNAQIGDEISLVVNLLIPTVNKTQARVADVEILGLINLIPGGFSTRTALASPHLMKRLFAEALEVDVSVFDGKELPSDQYIVQAEEGLELSFDEILDMKTAFAGISGITSITSLQEQLQQLDEEGSGFGITGLLTMSAIVSLIAAWISAFSFSAILMERRKREFAVVRAIGGFKSQVYKMALGENGLMMTTSVIWGILIGIGVSINFNGIFHGISGVLLRGLSVKRLIVFPWFEILLFSGFTLAGMLIATLLSIRNAVNADLTVATREE